MSGLVGGFVLGLAISAYAPGFCRQSLSTTEWGIVGFIFLLSFLMR